MAVVGKMTMTVSFLVTWQQRLVSLWIQLIKAYNIY